jgi:hypothetical protein
MVQVRPNCTGAHYRKRTPQTIILTSPIIHASDWPNSPLLFLTYKLNRCMYALYPDIRRRPHKSPNLALLTDKNVFVPVLERAVGCEPS